ncbi:MAG TPA: hypothetical protein VMS11_02525 [Solirubrobacterales bacterium]|nr:hypothetical protein [Solirubrobacterales bacterium]
MESRRLGTGQVRGMFVCFAVLIAALVPAIVATQAKAAPLPVLEFVPKASVFPVSFTADGGEVTAAMTDFDTVVHCSGSHGEGKITGPRSTLSNYVFTGCETQGGTKGGQACESEGANAKEIKSEMIEANLVYIDQAKHQVGMLLNPNEGTYLDFKCGGESVKALGSFLSPVGPINQEATSFSASLSRSGALQIPNEYENALGEKRKAIPTGEREGQPAATTGVELAFTIHTSVPLQIKAVTAAEIEARQRQDEAAAAAAAKKRQDEEAAYKAAVIKRLEAEAQLERVRRALLSSSLKQCRVTSSKHKRVRCEKRVKKLYGGVARKD